MKAFLFLKHSLLLFLTIISCSLFSQNTWLGGSTDWFTDGNWSLGTKPVASDNVVIPSGLVNYPAITGNAVCANLTINSKASVTINATRQLTVNGNLVIESDATGTGAILDLGTLVVTGTSTIKQFMSSSPGYYHYFTCPVMNATTAQVEDDITMSFPNVYYSCDQPVHITSCTGPNTILRFDESHTHAELNNDMNGWKYIAKGETFDRIRGYALLNQTNKTVDFTGSFYTGNVSYTVTKTASSTDLTHNGKSNLNKYGCICDPGGDICSVFREDCNLINITSNAASGWNLIGNPYPSPINWHLVAPGLTNIDPNIYYFMATSGFDGQYLSYNGNNDIPGARRYVPAMQSFFVKTTADEAVNLTNNFRTVSSDAMGTSYYKDYKSKSDYPQITLNTGLPSYQYSDNLIVYFPEGATNNYNSKIDVLKLMNTDKSIPNIYTFKDSQNLSICGLPELTVSSDDIIIPLIIDVNITANYFIKATEILNFPQYLNVYLNDKLADSIIDLRTAQQYVCNIENIHKSDRFELLITKSNITGIEKQSVKSSSVFFNDNILYVDYRGNKGLMQVFSIEGRQIGKTESLVKGRNTFEMKYPAGIYIVRINDTEGVNIYKVYIN